ncbi:hypothetical protein PT974_07839 [Cladobotryum mycophilum]|uniref:Ubiquitin-like protease family profile domain-containing protein n=1 Tax=Cladobotryum mycophilum TaxID=491253 RepID=A0ABR0SJ67_9HYPO
MGRREPKKPAQKLLGYIMEILGSIDRLDNELYLLVEQLPLTERRRLREFASILSNTCESKGLKDHDEAAGETIEAACESRGRRGGALPDISQPPECADAIENYLSAGTATPRALDETESDIQSPSMLSTIVVATEDTSISSDETASPRGNSSSNKPTPTEKHARPVRVSSSLLSQSIGDFIRHSREVIGNLSAPTASQEMFKSVFDSVNNAEPKIGDAWSDGSGWLSLLKVGRGEKLRGTMRYVSIAMAFADWHHSQVQLISPGAERKSKEAQDASGHVVNRMLQFVKEEDQKENRKTLHTSLTRGRKWNRLKCGLGVGILIMDPWGLGKSSEEVLDKLIAELPRNEAKWAVLKLLDVQVTEFFRTGRTNETLFNDGLRPTGPKVGPPPQLTQAKMLQIPEQGRLLVREACLHVLDKLSFVRVGRCISIHYKTGPNSGAIMKDPFQVAARKMESWREEMQAEPVCFFPLFLRNNHFSLLEINHRTKTIHHYDSIVIRPGEMTDVERACAKAFPQLQYVEERVIQQTDDHSCGPIVVKHARLRMLGLPATFGVDGKYSAEALRVEIIDLLNLAWMDDAITEAPPPQRKRRAAVRAQKFNKRLRGGRQLHCVETSVL